MEHRAEAVEAILKDCLFKEEEILDGKPPADAVIVEGVVQKFGFHPGRLKVHEAEIKQVLEGLPDQFYPTPKGGGGWSFLNLCMDAVGLQWGEHRNMEQLCVLAIASGKGQWLLPREMWGVLPGSMPYVVLAPEGLPPTN